MPPDVADELRKWWPGVIAAVGESPVVAYADSTDDQLSGRSITSTLVGDGDVTVNLYRARVSIDCRAESEGEAVRLARIAAGCLQEAEHEQAVAGMTVVNVRLMSLPYVNPDPKNPVLARVSFAAQLIAKGQQLPIQ